MMMNRVTNGSGHKQTTPKTSLLDLNEAPSGSESCMSKGSESGRKQTTPKSPSFDQTEPLNKPESCGSKVSRSGHVAAQRPELSGRERLKRHRAEMAGQVWIPDVWGQEGLLKDWAENCTSFDAMRNTSLVSARAALIQEGRIRANSSRLRIEHSC